MSMLDAGTAERNQTNMEIRLDEKVTNADETKALGIQVGDFISFDPRTVITETGFIKSRHLDDKVSVAILLQILVELAKRKHHFLIRHTFSFQIMKKLVTGATQTLMKTLWNI